MRSSMSDGPIVIDDLLIIFPVLGFFFLVLIARRSSDAGLLLI